VNYFGRFLAYVMFSYNAGIVPESRRRVCVARFARCRHRGRSLPSPTASCCLCELFFYFFCTFSIQFSSCVCVCVYRVGGTRTADDAARPAAVQLSPRSMDRSGWERDQDPRIRARIWSRHSGRVPSGVGRRPASSHHQSPASVQVLVLICRRKNVLTFLFM